MTEKDFINLYWKQYIMIEKEFNTSIKYLALDTSNFLGFSDVYAKLLLQIGSEVDVVAKIICKEINQASTADKINLYKPEVLGKFPEFESVTVNCGNIDLYPWQGWSTSSPDWWSIYNGVKHNRNKVETYSSIEKENYKFANQGTVLNALAGLYQLEQYLYCLIPHSQSDDTPLPGSRLFELKNQGWERKHFGKDFLLYKKNECLYTSFADTLYSDI